MNETQKQVIRWLSAGRFGMSSKCMAMWLAFDEKEAHLCCPLDPADFDRCLKLLQKAPGLRPLIPKMAELSDQWAAIAKSWDKIEASHLDEVGLGWSKAKSAPKTYAIMKSILDPISRRQSA